MKEFVKKMHALDGRYTVAELFADFLTLSANSLANHCDWQFFAKREQEALRIQAKYDERTLQTFSELLAMLMHKANQAMAQRELVDLFNLLFMAGFSDSQKGQFFTPLAVSQFMSNVGLDVSKPIIKQGEMSCGSGGMVIATANTLMKQNIDYQQRLLVECGDKDLRCVQMCYIQLYLYGIPAIVLHRNELSGETYASYRTLTYVLNENQGAYRGTL